MYPVVGVEPMEVCFSDGEQLVVSLCAHFKSDVVLLLS